MMDFYGFLPQEPWSLFDLIRPKTGLLGQGRHKIAAIALVCLCLGVTAPACAEDAPAAANPAPPVNDYPTSARVDYVIGCMASNGDTPIARDKCSCSIDAIAAILPYDQYVEAETVLSMRQTSGPNAGMFRDAPQYKAVVEDLRRAQAEAETKCF